MGRSVTGISSRRNRRRFGATAGMLLALLCLLASGAPAFSQDSTDWITGLPRAPIHVQAWPGGKKVAVCFVLYVEVWGHGQGPNFRSDMGGRDPDIVDESFRQYAIDWGIPRVGRVFHDQDTPLSIALNALFPEQQPDVWKQFRALLPQGPHRRPWHEQFEPAPAAGRRPRRAEGLYPQDDRSDREGDGRALARLVEPQRLSQCRYLHGHGRRRHHLHARQHGFRHLVAALHQAGTAGPDPLSHDHGRYGAISRPRQGAERYGAAVDRLCRRIGEGGRGRSQPRGHGRRHRHPSLRDGNAHGCGGLAPGPRAFQAAEARSGSPMSRR